MKTNLHSNALEANNSSEEAVDLRAMAEAVQKDSRVGLRWNAVLLGVVSVTLYLTSGTNAVGSALMGGLLGAANLVAITWITARILTRGQSGFGSSMALVGAKFVVLVGVVGAIVLLLKPDVLPFLLGFSTSLPIVVGICVLRFGR